MGTENRAYQQSVERWENANQSMADAFGHAPLLERLSQNQPDSIELLNVQAYEREAIATMSDRYISACDNYFDSLDKPLTAEQRDEFIQNIPLEANSVAELSYYMEQMTPEIVRYKRALGESGASPDGVNEAFSSLPDNRIDIKDMADYYIENADSGVKPYSDLLGSKDTQTVANAVLSELDPTPGVIAAKSFQVEQGVGPEFSREQESVKLGMTDSFARADSHVGDKSLETIKIEQSQAVSDVVLPPPDGSQKLASVAGP